MTASLIERGLSPRLGEGAAARDFFANPGLRPALREMRALGLDVSEQPWAGARPYCLLSGRGDSRWFMLPQRPRAVCASSLAFVQPVRPLPRAFKGCAVAMARLGLTRFPGRRMVHVSGVNRLAGVFDCEIVHDAFFSGTAGPHRKLVVQFMDGAGHIKGYAKVACAPAVHALLAREASIMQELGRIGLKSATTPRVLLNEIRNGAAVLLMDTLDVSRRYSPSALRMTHLHFLDELAVRTEAAWARSGDVLLRGWDAQMRALAASLSSEWRIRFGRALWMLAARPELIASRGLAHGDFTPGNTFTCRDRLFVFDWEYAGGDYPADFDLIRYLDAQARLATTRPWRRADAILRRLVGELGRGETEAYGRLVAYYCVYALRGARRQPQRASVPIQWESGRDDAAMLDALLTHPRFAGLGMAQG